MERPARSIRTALGVTAPPASSIAETFNPTNFMELTIKPHIGLSDGARLEVGQMLNLLLADEYVLYATAHDYHWNVTGPNFEG